MTLRNRYLILFAAVAAAHLLLFSTLPVLIRTTAALLIVGVGPAILLARLLLPDEEKTDRGLLERWVVIAALSFTSLTIGMLLLSYLPGAIERWQVLLFYDALILVLAAVVWREQRRMPAALPAVDPPASGPDAASRRRLAVGLVILLLTGALLRVIDLGYSEFHGDEARAVLRASAAIQGYEDALVAHRKGPVELLVPASILVLTGHIDEASARLPFALAGLAGVVAVWMLGWRMGTSTAGWLAALLVTVGGYFVAFARFLQYQSVVVLTTVAALMVVAALLQEGVRPSRRLTLASLLFASGLLAHYDALAAGPPLAVLLFYLLVRAQDDRWQLVKGIGIAAGVGLVCLALYFVPFVLNPAFASTVDYLVGDRIGSSTGSPPYNNLVDLFVRGSLYNSTYMMMMLSGLLLVGLLLVYRQGYGKLWGGILGAAALIVPVWLLANGGSLAVTSGDPTVIPITVLLLLACGARGLTAEQRALWVWFAAAFIVTIFLTSSPRTHVYVFFVPWMLIAGDVLAAASDALDRRARALRPMVAAAAAAMLLLMGGYVYLLYVYNDAEILRTWPRDEMSIYWSPEDVSAVDGRFGFPFANGWKVVGALYASGEIAGDYETNQRYMWVPDWYTRGRYRCGSTAEWFFAVNSLEPWMEDQAQVVGRLVEQGYHPWGVVTVAGDPRMTIYRTGEGGAPGNLRTFALEEYAATFDQLADANVPLSYPVIVEKPAVPLYARFGDEIVLEGYELSPQGALRPGETFRLKLFWRAVGPSTGSHKVSVQSYYGNGVMVAQKDALPVCDREPTTTWEIGDLVVDTHDVTIAADAPPGVYPLYVSLYREESGAPLEASSNEAPIAGAQVQLGRLTIEDGGD